MKQSKKRKLKKKITCKSDKSDTIKKRIKEKQKLFLSLHDKKACNVSLTCNAIGISRETYYEWRKKYPSFNKACEDSEEGLIDRAESQLVINWQSGKETSLIFFLCNKGKHRGWQNRHMIEGNPDMPLTVVISDRYEPKTGKEQKGAGG